MRHAPWKTLSFTYKCKFWILGTWTRPLRIQILYLLYQITSPLNLFSLWRTFHFAGSFHIHYLIGSLSAPVWGRPATCYCLHFADKAIIKDDEKSGYGHWGCLSSCRRLISRPVIFSSKYNISRQQSRWQILSNTALRPTLSFLFLFLQ